MTLPILLTFAITAGTLGLFLWDRLRADVVGVITMVALMLVGVVTPHEGISGFANEATVTVAAMLALSAGLVRTGAVDLLGRWMARFAAGSEPRLFLLMLLTVIPLSAFLNNTAVVAILLPIVLGLTHQMKVSPSRMLMPLSFASQLGGTLTLIGTSTNLLVAGLVLDLGMDRIHLFDITPPALLLGAIGLVYLLTVGRWLLPARTGPQDLVGRYELREYLTGLIVEADSPLAGATLAESRFGEEHGLQVIGIDRPDGRVPFPNGRTRLEAGDLLQVRGRISEIAQITEVDHLRIAGTRPRLGLVEENAEGDSSSRLAELIVTPRSPVIGRTIRDLNFRERYRATALAIQRYGTALHVSLRDTSIAAGDVLLVDGTGPALRAIHDGGELALLGPVRVRTKRTRKIRIAVAIMLGVVALPAMGIAPILVSSLAGVVAMIATGCLRAEEAYEEVDWMVIILIGSLISLGVAMQKTGAAQLLAGNLVALTEAAGPHGVLAVIFVLTTLFTAVISNNATAVVLTPIAVATGSTLGVSPLPFVIGVMIAASNSFITPIGYQTNIFIYGPGGYRFGDFFRVGAPLNVILAVAATLIIPFFFPF
ncbi:SLC13 family permease [soil metagenome]